MDLDKLYQPTPDVTSPITIRRRRLSMYDIQYQAKLFQRKM